MILFCFVIVFSGAYALDFKPCLNVTSKSADKGALTVAAGNWDAAIILGRIAQIIVNEGIGIRADFNAGFGGSTDVMRALVGCIDDSCTMTLDVPEVHMDFEYWSNEVGDTIYRRHQSKLVKGFIGYDGQEGLYIKDSIAQSIWHDYKVALEYHISLSHPGRPWMSYFTKVSSITIPIDSGCRDAAAEQMAAEGMPCDADGWWYSPACSNDTDTCIPVLMGGFGWTGLETSRIIKYNHIPMAVSFVDWPDQRIVEGTINAMFYWWRPDWTFNGLGPVRRVVFPKHNRQEWAQKIYRTDFPDYQLTKLMSIGVNQISYKASRMFDNFEMSWSQINELMDEMYQRAGTGDPDLHSTVACEWALANQASWRQWFPVIAPCAAGFGVIQGACGACPSATLSVWDSAMGNQICGPCPEGKYCETGTVYAAACPKGHYCPVNSSNPKPCPAGHQLPQFQGISLSDCIQCPRGSISSSVGTALCTNCSAGQYLDAIGGTSCKLCSPGQEQPQQGQTSCKHCQPGTFSAEQAKILCDACPRGFFADMESSISCEPCQVGTYAEAGGSTACSSCPMSLSTPSLGSTSIAACVCPVDSYYVNVTPHGHCAPCSEGLLCVGDASAPGDQPPRLQLGYMIYPPLKRGQPLPDAIQTFRCLEVEKCLGGPDLWSQQGICGTRVGVACDLCPARHWSSDGACQPCAGSSYGSWLVAIFTSPLLALYLYQQINSENLDEDDEACASISWSQSITHKITRLTPAKLRQTSGLFKSYVWKPAMKESNRLFLRACRDELYTILRDTFQLLLDFLQNLGVLGRSFRNESQLLSMIVGIGQILNIDIPMISGTLDSIGLKSSCMIGSGFIPQYLTALCLPLWVALVFGLNLTIFIFVVCRIRPKLADVKCCRNIPLISITIDKTINALGTQICAMFIGVTSMSTSLFVTYRHPGGERSLQRYPSVLWGEADWYTALPLGILGFLVYTVFVITGAIWVCIRAPRWAHIQSFRVRYYFLLDGYRPEAWYWGVILLFKALIINLILVIFDSAQLICIFSLIVFVSFLCLKFKLKPWPNQTMNITDTTYSVAMCVIIPAMYIRHGQHVLVDVDILVRIVEEVASLAPILITCLCLSISIHRFLHKTDRAVWRLRKVKRLQNIMFFAARLSGPELNAFILDLDDQDQKTLWNAMHVLYAGLLKWQADSSLFQQIMIPNAESYQTMDDAEMLRRIVQVALVEHKDDHCFHERALLQHVNESLVQSHMSSTGGDTLLDDGRVVYGRIFDMLDSDGSGVLSREEFVSGTVKLSHEVTHDEAMWAFNFLDIDGSGSLTRQEFDESFRGLCVDPLHPDSAEERKLVFKLATSLRSGQNERAHVDAALRRGRKHMIPRAANRIQRWFKRRKYKVKGLSL